MGNHVYYHKNCIDGWAAAYAVWSSPRERTLRVRNQTDAEEIATQYHPMGYGDAVEFPEDMHICYFVDICPTQEQFDDAYSKSEKVVIYDHHDTAKPLIDKFKEDYQRHLGGLFQLDYLAQKGKLEAVYSDYHCGATLTWVMLNTLQAGNDLPLLYQYVRDRDLWQWKLPHSREVSAYLASLPKDFETWDALENQLQLDYGVSEVQSAGAAILRSQQQQVESALERVRFQRWCNKDNIPTVNSSVLQSEVAEALYTKYPDAPFVVVWFETATHQKYSIRTTSDTLHVGHLAQGWYGGGGHQKAGGWEWHR